MSAFLCSDTHISVLVNAARAADIQDITRYGVTSGDDLFTMLREENLKSLRERYEEADEMFATDDTSYFRIHAQEQDIVQVIKAANCYDYQSCEHDGWKSSKAKQYVDDLISSLLYSLPGYDAAQGSIDDPAEEG